MSPPVSKVTAKSSPTAIAPRRIRKTTPERYRFVVHVKPLLNQANGREYTVQYFERNRFEWHPELSQVDNVQLGLLGREWLDAAPP